MKKNVLTILDIIGKKTSSLLEFINKGRFLMVKINPENEFNPLKSSSDEILKPLIDLNKDLTIEELEEMISSGRRQIEDAIQNKLIIPENLRIAFNIIDLFRKSKIIKSIEEEDP